MTAEVAESTTHVLARVAAVLWVVSAEDLPFAEVQAKVRSFISVLNEDPRVTATEAPDQLVAEYCFVTGHYPKVEQPSLEVLTGRDSLNVLEISAPIEFSVRVPVKNQPKVSDVSDVPSDVYRCAWDGETLVVAWEQDTTRVPISAGQVVVDILRDALTMSGDAIYVQACSPSCRNLFLHQTLVTVPATDQSVTLAGASGRAVTARVPDFGLAAITWFIHNAFGGSIRAFARAKSAAQRMRDLEEIARDNLGHLLGHYADHAQLTAIPFHKSLRTRWRRRGWRREAQLLMTNVWLALSGIEALRAEWSHNRAYVRRTQEISMAVEPDFRDDDEEIEKMDLAHVESATEHLANRIDSRSLTLATAVGALGGALSGAVVGGLFGWLT